MFKNIFEKKLFESLNNSYTFTNVIFVSKVLQRSYFKTIQKINKLLCIVRLSLRQHLLIPEITQHNAMTGTTFASVTK